MFEEDGGKMTRVAFLVHLLQADQVGMVAQELSDDQRTPVLEVKSVGRTIGEEFVPGSVRVCIYFGQNVVSHYAKTGGVKF